MTHNDLLYNVYSLNQVTISPFYPRKMSLYGLYENANGFELISDCYNTNNTGQASNFEIFPSGDITSFGDFGCQSVLNVWHPDTFCYDNYELYPSGSITQLNSGVILKGYIWQ